jgi:succinate-semialdehyde dehydrogenase/glutarate-semialdehyde dehydrogenase
VVVGGTRMGERFYTPTVLADVTGDMLCAREETFGPVAPVFRFKTEAEAIAAGQRHRVRPGQLLLQPRHRPHLPRRRGAGVRHGGHQHRPDLDRRGAVRRRQAVGLGREGAHHGIDDYVEIKYLCLGDILK